MGKMKYGHFIWSFLFLTFQLHAQTDHLMGKWILDRIVYKDGRRLEINNEQYSTGVTYIIGPGFIKMNDQKFNAVIKLGKIQTQYVTFNYERQQEYLAIYEDQSDIISFFLKPDDFLKKYPEFTPVRTVVNGDSVTIANELSDFEFNSDVNLDEFIRKRMTDRPSKSFKNLYFRAMFVLTKDNKVTNLKVLNSISDAYDNEYLNALKSAEPFFSNHTGTDLLITREADYLLVSVKDPEEKKMYEILSTADAFYSQNQFDKAIEDYSKIKKLTIKNNRYRRTIKRAMMRLGIAYLASGNLQQACDTFKSIGDHTDFELRHYINDFCNSGQESH